jgi:hypothetical protein
VTARPLEVRTVLLSLYYADLLERHNLGERPVDGDPAPAAKIRYTSSDSIVSAPDGSAIIELRTPVLSAQPPLAAPIMQPPVPAPTAQQPTPPRAPPVGATMVPPAAAPVARPAPLRPSLSPETAPRATNGRPVGSSMQAVPAPDAALRSALLQLTQKLETISHFELLGVSESASAGDVSSAFIRAARRFHPDRLAGTGLSDLIPQADRLLARMSEAAMILGDPAHRAEYLAARTGKKPSGSTVPTVIDAETTFLKGEVFLKRSDHDKAIECFAAASKANPGEPQYRAYWAWARFDNPHGRKEAVVREAQRIIADAVAAQPRFARGHYWLGLIWKFLNEPDRAERAFRDAMKQDKDFLEASREMRLLEMRRLRGRTPHKSPERGGLMDRLFKK